MRETTFTHPAHGPDEAAKSLAQLGFDLDEETTVRRTLLDTFDRRLQEAHLRLEAVDRDGSLSLVLSDPDSIPAVTAVGAIPRFAGDLPRGPLRSRLLGVTEVRALLPVLTCVDLSRPAARRSGHDKTIATATIHRKCSIVDPPGVASLPWSIDVRELPGHHKQASAVIDELVTLGYEPASGDVIEQALDASRLRCAYPRTSPTVDLRSDMPAIEGFGAVLANLLATINANWQGTIDDIDTEFLHELRVAIRRSRSVLGQSKGVIPMPVRDEFREELRWLAFLTGPTRDVDVYILEWDRYVSELEPASIRFLGPVLEHLREHRTRSHHELVQAMESARTQKALCGWRDALAHRLVADYETTLANDPLSSVVRRRLRKAHNIVVDNGRRIHEESPGEELHELRKDAKRLRYIVECFGSVLPVKPRKEFVRHLKGLQDNLGEHQDAEVHAAELRKVGRELSHERAAPDTLIALGQLTEQLELTKRAMRAEFKERFAGFDSNETRSTLGELLEALET
jgi:CHAD domain-containing protein